MTFMLAGSRWYVVGRVFVEEVDGFEHKSEVAGGHDWPVFGAGDVEIAEGVPDDDIGVGDRAIGFRPFR